MARGIQKFQMSDKVLSGIQITACIMGNYALIPNILYNIQERSPSSHWSMFDTIMSVCGYAIRIFTSTMLTNDRVLINCYISAMVCNLVLLLQHFVYK